jgi:hypothetical protein
MGMLHDPQYLAGSGPGSEALEDSRPLALVETGGR